MLVVLIEKEESGNGFVFIAHVRRSKIVSFDTFLKFPKSHQEP